VELPDRGSEVPEFESAVVPGTSFLGGALPGATPFHLCLQGEAQKSPDKDNAGKETHALNGQWSGDRRNYVRTNEQFEAEENAPAEIGAKVLICRQPIASAITEATKGGRGNRDPADDDCHASKLYQLSELVDDDVHLIGHAVILRVSIFSG